MKKKCLCRSFPKEAIKDKEGRTIAIPFYQDFNCPVHFPEYSCEHKWKAGGITKRQVVIFCEKCGKIETKLI